MELFPRALGVGVVPQGLLANAKKTCSGFPCGFGGYGMTMETNGLPCIVPVHEWCARALARWSDRDYWRSSHPVTQVEVSATVDGYLSGTLEEHSTIKMPFARFLDQLQDEEPLDAPWRRRSSQLRYHLAQCPLSPTSLPDLHESAWPPPAAVPADRVAAVNLWFAIGPTTSGLHYDAYNNLLVAVRGTKRLLLLPPEATAGWFGSSHNLEAVASVPCSP